MRAGQFDRFYFDSAESVKMQIVHFHSNNKHGTSQIGWSVFVRRLASGILVTFMCCAFMIVLRDPSVSLVEDDATSLEHVRNLLSTLDRTAVWNSISSTQASNPFIAAAPNVRFEQPVLIKALQNPLEQQSNAVQPKIEFLPTQPYAEPTSYAKSGTDSAFVFLPSPSNFPETEVQGNFPGPQATVLPQHYLKSPFISNADLLSTGILPQAVDGSWAIPASRVLTRPILERHDLEEWLRLREMTKSSLNVKALDAFSKSKQSVAQAFLASAQASQAAASASLGIKTGAAAAAAAASAAAAVEAEAAAAAEAGAEAGAGVSPANATLDAGSS